MKFYIMGLDAFFHSYRTEIGLAELLQVLALLQPSQREDLITISAILGFEWRERLLQPADDLKSASGQTVAQPQNTQANLSSELENSEHISKPVQTPNQTPKLLQPSSQEAPIFETIFNKSRLELVDKELEPTNITLHMKAPEYRPLFKMQWSRGIMSLILSTLTDSRDLDWQKLEKQLANARPLDRLPLKQRPTLKRGVLLFLDRSDSMQPFWRDEKELLGQIKRLFGPQNVRAWWVEVDRWSSIEYQLKWYSHAPRQLPMGTPLLVVSDFGCKGEASSEGTLELEPWLPLFNQARINRCKLVALMPAPEPFWPKWLMQHFSYAFTWDEYTSTQKAARQLRGKPH